MTDKQIIDGVNLHGNRKDLTGLKVGKLTCLKPVKTGKNKHSEWLCECECGNFKIAQTYRLLSGRIQSCGDCYHTINHYIPMIKELEKQLKAKEQECEELKKIIDEAKNSKLDLKSFLVGEAVQNEYEQQLDQLKAENDTLFKAIEEVNKINKRLETKNEELKIYIESNEQQVKEVETLVMDNDRLINELTQYKQTLTEIKPILEFYANSKMGEEQPDRTYKIMLSSGYIMAYDPKPARQALQKISEGNDDVI